MLRRTKIGWLMLKPETRLYARGTYCPTGKRNSWKQMMSGSTSSIIRSIAAMRVRQ